MRIEDRFDTGIDDVWSALTDPRRLASWYGEVEGDLREGGEFRLHVKASGWDGTGRVEGCEPPTRLGVTTRETDDSWREGQGAPPFDAHIDVTLMADGDRSILVVEVRGMPLDKIAAYGVGWQIHVEDLGAYIAEREVSDAESRWKELIPTYERLADDIGKGPVPDA